jgi:hypothetical protein
MRFLTLEELLELHRLVVSQTGGRSGLRDRGGMESALAQPRMTFGREGAPRRSIGRRCVAAEDLAAVQFAFATPDHGHPRRLRSIPSVTSCPPCGSWIIFIRSRRTTRRTGGKGRKT